MSRPDSDSVETEEMFNIRLTSLVQKALEEGVDIDNAWVCRTSDGVPDYEIVCVELTDQAN